MHDQGGQAIRAINGELREWKLNHYDYNSAGALC